MNKAQKNLFRFICSLLIFSHSTLYDHGFAAKTLVQLDDESWQPIESLCRDALHNIISVTSYDMNALCNVDNYVKQVGQSKFNCYIQLSFDSGCCGAPNTITCSPTQEFYVPALNKWVPAYTLSAGDALLSKNNNEKFILYIEFVEKPLKTYMLEVQDTHTFFVGKDAILTHNIVLPIAVSLGIAVPFGSAAAGTAGSFFGPIGMMGGVVLGGIISVAVKIACENRIPRHKTSHDIASITAHRHAMQRVEDSNPIIKNDGCFSPNNQPEIIRVHIMPIENLLPQSAIGCIEIEFIPKEITKTCFPAPEIEPINENGCFDPTQQNDLPLFNALEKAPTTDNVKNRYQGEKARNWKEFERDCHMGQQHGKKFINTGKQNPKDKAPIYKLLENIPGAEMFKKDYLFALDKFHEGDHFEVWDKKGNWIGVANLDGSKNHAKSSAEKNPGKRNLRY